jgi:hypothetical protein
MVTNAPLAPTHPTLITVNATNSMEATTAVATVKEMGQPLDGKVRRGDCAGAGISVAIMNRWDERGWAQK